VAETSRIKTLELRGSTDGSAKQEVKIVKVLKVAEELR
jgi:hypothetical protein